LRRKKAAGAGTVAELKVLVVGSMAVAVVAVVVLLLPQLHPLAAAATIVVRGASLECASKCFAALIWTLSSSTLRLDPAVGLRHVTCVCGARVTCILLVAGRLGDTRQLVAT
jgi:cell division septal protein FtsQ